MKRSRAASWFAAAVSISIASGTAASGQSVDGYVSIMGDALPHVRVDTGERIAVMELRARVFLEQRVEIGERIRITGAGFVEGLVADRVPEKTTRAAIIRPHELHVEARWAKADLRVGLSRVVWGRLDEFLPTDVVNPQDVARFFLEGRSEGRMPVVMVRGRLLPSDRFTVETVYVPVFRRGRFDQLGETTSPFNPGPQSTCPGGSAPCASLVPIAGEPNGVWGSSQGGVRASVTTGRIDWSVSAYRGLEPLPVYEWAAIKDDGSLRERFPRFTMVGGDFEMVRGEWGFRGEVAAFVDRTLQVLGSPVTVEGGAVEGGAGVDRKAGAYRVSANLVLAKRWADPVSEVSLVAPSATTSPRIDRTDFTVVAAIDRSFVRETRTVRVFSVYNPGEHSAFARVISTFNLRDNVSVEGSAGWFTGDGTDALSRFATRDFVYARLKVSF